MDEHPETQIHKLLLQIMQARDTRPPILSPQLVNRLARQPDP